MLGLSATPERVDNFERISYWGIGEVVNGNKLADIDKVKNQFKCKVIITKYSGDPYFTKPVINEKLGMTDGAVTKLFKSRNISIKKEYRFMRTRHNFELSSC